MSSARTLAIAAVAGCATMIVELAAVRLLAPWFGGSIAVWTIVIVVVLVALALGAFLGARLAKRLAAHRTLATMLLAAAGWSASLPYLARFACDAFLPSAGDSSDPVGWGSLIATAILLAPLATVFGAATPLCVEVLERSVGLHAGIAGARVLAVSTVASLVGAWAASAALVPRTGLVWTHAIVAGLLMAAAALSWFRPGETGGERRPRPFQTEDCGRSKAD